ncbi:MAG: hypothetical protein CME26_02280 [Gemmatimonadetes bacterium]|nr:hypothetical protein [Gemmatimonadota bacterium]
MRCAVLTVDSAFRAGDSVLLSTVGAVAPEAESAECDHRTHPPWKKEFAGYVVYEASSSVSGGGSSGRVIRDSRSTRQVSRSYPPTFQGSSVQLYERSEFLFGICDFRLGEFVPRLDLRRHS